MTLFSLFLSPLLLFAPLLTTALQLWKQPADFPSSIPVSCRAGLSTNVTCAPVFVSAANVLEGLPYDNNFLSQYCTSSCYASLKSYQTTVASRCRGQTYAFAPGVNQTGEAVADALLWAYNVTCIKDSSTSSFCTPQIFNATAKPCSNCLLGYQAAALQAPLYGQRIVDRNAFSSTLSSCHVPSGSFTIPPAISTTTTFQGPTSTAFCPGSIYTAKPGDTCKSISQANKVGQDIFVAQNRLAYSCDTIPAGTKLCIGASCDLHQVAANETCKNITASLHRVSSFELSNWNPTIHSNCDNLAAMVGRLICVSPPGGKWTPDDNSIPGVNNGGAASTPTFTPFLPTTNMVPVHANPSPPTNFSTATWGIPEPPTHTRIWNATAVSAIVVREKYCPDFSNTTVFSDEGLPDDCQKLWDPYCHPRPDDPIRPSPTNIPSTCQPAYWSTNTYDGGISTGTANTVTSTSGSSKGTTQSTTPATGSSKSAATKSQATQTTPPKATTTKR